MGKVWDCFMFGGELELLSQRLFELEDVVDHFVICESARTHSGRPKPLYYFENRERYERWAKKIVHVVAELPEHASSAWRREEQQRRSIRDLLRERARDEDAIVMGDVDEFIDRDALATLVERCDEPVTLGMAYATYFANWWMPQQWAAPPVFARGSQLGEPLVRSLLGEPHEQWDGFRQRIVDDCGIHVSYTGGAAAIRTKFLGHPDTYLSGPRFHVAGYVEWCIHQSTQFEGWGVLRRLDREELTPLLQRLYRRAPDLFDFTPAPPVLQSRALCAYARFRRSDRVPNAVIDWFDRHPRVVTGGIATPFFLAIEGARLLRRRIRGQKDAPFFIPLESSLRSRSELRRRPQLLDPIHVPLPGIVDGTWRSSS